MTTQVAATEALPGAQSAGLATRILHPAVTTDASSFEAAARAAERVAVCLDAPGPDQRTKLASFVLSSIEVQLERLGAAPRGWTARDSLEMVLSDQLYRSRLLGAGGIALKLGELDGIADASGALSLEDSHVLRRMFDLAELEPLQVFLPEPSARLCVAGAPRPLADWLPAGSRSGKLASIEYESGAPEALPSSAPNTPESLAPPPLDAFVRAFDSPAVTPSEPAPSQREPSSAAPMPALLDENERPTVVPASAPSEPIASAAFASADGSTPAPASAGATKPDAPSAVSAPMPALPAPDEQEAQQRRCASWLAQLQSMNGPKQHASVERAFLTAYLPLSREVAMGRAPAAARDAVEAWAAGFAQSYAAAFKTLNGHARRPTMVRDIFDVAQRWLNQFRARNLQLLLIDGMRFDLGQRLNESIEQRLAGSAVCRDQALLWAALPSNSSAQRLADGGAPRAPRAEKPKGAAAGSAERSIGIENVRVGTRELFRLDRLATDLSKSGELEAQRLERLATLLADTVVPWLKERTPDTLVVVFGDHGFHWQSSADGTSTAQRGGALPEQVLVPASAWLLGTTRPKAGTAPGLH